MKYANIGRDLSGGPVRLPMSTLSSLLGGLPGRASRRYCVSWPPRRRSSRTWP